VTDVPAISSGDRIVLALVRGWCFVRYPRLCSRTGRRSGERPDAATPSSYADKFLWRKIFDHDPRFTQLSEKLTAKKHALSICPELKTAKVLWTGDDPALIPAELLAGSVVVKANHGCGWNVMIRGGKVDLAEMRRKTADWVRRRYGQSFGEWAYRDAKRCLFVEEMLIEDGDPVHYEYKFHMSSGRTAYAYAARRNERGEEVEKCHFDADGRISPPPATAPANWVDIKPPASFDRMRAIAEKLTTPFDHMRCDFYELNGEIYFSEFCVYPLSGQGIHNTRLRDHCNETWDIRESWFLTTPQTGWRKRYAAALRRWLDRRQRRGAATPLR